MTDEELLKMFRKGDDQAFHSLFKRYEGPLIAYIYRQTNNLEMSKDVCQESFSKLIHKPPRFTFGGKLKPWLYRVARNLAIDKLRRASRQLADISDLPEQVDETLCPAGAFLQENDHQHLRQLVAELPAELQEVVRQRVYAGLTFKEIAETSGIPLGTALWRMQKALKMLRLALNRQETFP